jgi:hypothetical protein
MPPLPRRQFETAPHRLRYNEPTGFQTGSFNWKISLIGRLWWDNTFTMYWLILLIIPFLFGL